MRPIRKLPGRRQRTAPAKNGTSVISELDACPTSIGERRERAAGEESTKGVRRDRWRAQQPGKSHAAGRGSEVAHGEAQRQAGRADGRWIVAVPSCRKRIGSSRCPVIPQACARKPSGTSPAQLEPAQAAAAVPRTRDARWRDPVPTPSRTTASPACPASAARADRGRPAYQQPVLPCMDSYPGHHILHVRGTSGGVEHDGSVANGGAITRPTSAAPDWRVPDGTRRGGWSRCTPAETDPKQSATTAEQSAADRGQ